MANEDEKMGKFHWDDTDIVFDDLEAKRDFSGETAEQKKEAWAAVTLPDAVRSKIQEAAKSIPKEHLSSKGIETDSHITLAHGCDDGHQEAIQEILRNTPPIKFTLGGLMTFPDTGKGVPLVAKVYSTQLQQLHKRIHADVPDLRWEFDDYKPHVTLAYIDPQIASAYLRDKPFAMSLAGECGVAEAVNFNRSDNIKEVMPFASPALALFADALKGGIADDIDEEDWNDLGIPPEDLEEGIQVEMEHTDDPAVAKEIATDHLVEDPDYYRKLSTLDLSEEFADDGLYHGASPPKGWVQVGEGPRGGKIWGPPDHKKNGGGNKEVGDKASQPTALGTEEAIKALSDSSKSWAKSLTASEGFAVRRYETQDFREVNKGMRSGKFKDPATQSIANSVKSALDKASLPVPMTAHRVIVTKDATERDAIINNYLQNVGGSVVDKAFVSTSANPKYIDAVARKRPGMIRVEIDMPKGAKAAYISSLTGTTGGVGKQQGHEVVIQAGQRYEVVSVKGSRIKLKYMGA